ncbi:MAG TPA: hypothetical protein VF997_07375 [Polyangia bacterium]
MAWAFAIGGGVVGTLLGFYVPGIIGFILGAAVYVGAGWAAVHMTEASTGKGIVTMLVGGLVAGIVGFILVKVAASSAMSAAGGDAFKDAMKNAQAQGGTQLTAEQQAQLSQVGNAMAGGLGVIAGVMGFVWALLKTFLWGMIGCFIGGATKKSAVGAQPGALSKAA